jgi:leucine dehydrogenase
MSQNVQSLIEAWTGLAVVSHFDDATGAWIFICLHDNTLGPCTGGTRMKVYASPADGLLDAMRLAEGMTCKWAAIGEATGGGKAVLAIPEPLTGHRRTGLLLRYGRLVESLCGGFRTGEDLGTTSADMQVIAKETRFVHGFDPHDRSKVDPSPFTARAVFAGIRGAVAEVFGSSDLSGRTVLIQGVGNVGTNLARLLVEAGARILVSDVDPLRAGAAAQDVGGEVVPAAEVMSTPCDVYAPCAVGATLNPSTIPQLQCRIVAGSANNQLDSAADAELLMKRGIVYVPDYIINAGGALAFALLDRGVNERQEILARMDGIGDSVREVLKQAADNSESPLTAAQRRVEQALASAKAQG